MLDRRIFREIDSLTILLAVIISVIGIVFLYSAIYFQASHYIWRQIIWLIISLIITMVAILIDYKFLLTISFPLYVFLNIILLGLLLFGKKVANTRSWIVIGPFQGQPSELMKVVVILVLARIFSGYREDKMSFKTFALSSLVVGVPAILTALQPDLGTALTFMPVLLGVYILAGIRKKYVAILLIGLLLSGFAGWNFALKDYQKKRIETLMTPDQDPRGAGYQLRQSKIAIGSGGLTGKGYHKGTQSQLRFLPARHTDFIMAVIAEEIGFLGVVAVFILYALLMYRIFSTAWISPDRAGVYLAFLVGMMIGCQFLINVMMLVGLFPITGIPVPFLSYGGSSLLANFLALSLVLNVRMRRFAFI